MGEKPTAGRWAIPRNRAYDYFLTGSLLSSGFGLSVGEADCFVSVGGCPPPLVIVFLLSLNALSRRQQRARRLGIRSSPGTVSSFLVSEQKYASRGADLVFIIQDRVALSSDLCQPARTESCVIKTHWRAVNLWRPCAPVRAVASYHRDTWVAHDL